MKSKITAVLLILLLAAIVGHRMIAGHQASWSTSAGAYIAKNRQEADNFRTKLMHWLEANGFAPTQDPGGMTSWSGIHAEGEISRWYVGTYNNSPPFLFRVTSVVRTDIGGGFTEFHFSHTWSVRGTESYLARMRSLSDDFTETFVAWYTDDEARVYSAAGS